MNSSDRPRHAPANTTPDPCATCRLRDHWCCDPWETPQDHEQDTE